jgi:hypothetical protein
MPYIIHMSHCNTGEFEGSCKYGDEDCPAMHPAPELMNFLDKGAAAKLAKEYHDGGYICISNKYRTIGRPDCDDWHIVMAEQMRCAPADFYKRDGSGELCERWREHYIRCTTTDKLEISELAYNYMRERRWAEEEEVIRKQVNEE